MKVINRYEDLTVEQFQQLEELKLNTTLDKLDSAIKRLSILSGESVDYIESLSGTQVHDYLLQALFLTLPITEIASPNEFKLGNKKFRYIKHIHEYNIAQEKDWKEILLANKNEIVTGLTGGIAGLFKKNKVTSLEISSPVLFLKIYDIFLSKPSIISHLRPVSSWSSLWAA